MSEIYRDVLNWNESRYDKQRMLVSLWQYRDPMFPRRYSFDLTDFCNRRCHYCPVGVFGAKASVMSDDVFVAGVRRMKEIKWTGQVTYNGYGEPLSVKNLEHYTSWVREEVPAARSFIYTNGDYLTWERAQSLYAAGVEHIVVTRHEPYKDAWHERVMAVQAKAGKRMTLRSLPKSVLINPAGLVDVPYEPFSRCTLPSSNFTVTVNGDVRLCCADFLKEYTPGNIMNETVMDIWHKPEFKQIRRRLMFGSKQQLPVCVKCMAGLSEKPK